MTWVNANSGRLDSRRLVRNAAFIDYVLFGMSYYGLGTAICSWTLGYCGYHAGGFIGSCLSGQRSGFRYAVPRSTFLLLATNDWGTFLKRTLIFNLSHWFASWVFNGQHHRLCHYHQSHQIVHCERQSSCFDLVVLRFVNVHETPSFLAENGGIDGRALSQSSTCPDLKRSRTSSPPKNPPLMLSVYKSSGSTRTFQIFSIQD